MSKKTLCILVAIIFVVSITSCSKKEKFGDIYNMQNMTIETVDYTNSESVGNYLYSLRGLRSSDENNQTNYPTLDHLQYLYFYEGKGIYHCSILVDYSHEKLLYDYVQDVVMSHLNFPENIRDLTEEDIVGIQNLLEEQDIFSLKREYDGTGGKSYGEYEGYWGFSLLFDDGSAFVTSGRGDNESGWPNQYFILKDALFAMADK